MNYMIKGGLALLYDNGKFRTEEKDIYVTDGKISFLPPKDGEYEIYSAAGQLVMPGLVNMHTHAYMSIFRNYADDVSFDEWLFKRIMPVEDILESEDMLWTNLLSCIEMIQTGTTCFVDMHMFEGRSCQAAAESGLRAVIGRGLVGTDINGDGLERVRQALREKEKYESEMITFALAPHAIYSCNEDMYRQVAELAAEKGMLKETHLSESIGEVENARAQYGRSPVQVMADSGFLDGGAVLAHCVHLSDEDAELIRSSGSTIVTNPASNAKLGNGIAPVAKYLDMGINICIGTDGASSNNTLNMFREMALLSLMQKGAQSDCTVLSADQVIAMATLNAAKALKMEGKIGTISEGAAADLIFLDLDSASLFPNNNAVSSLCYSANGSEVVSVMAGGKLLMKNRELLTIDRERVYSEIRRIQKKYFS